MGGGKDNVSVSCGTQPPPPHPWQGGVLCASSVARTGLCACLPTTRPRPPLPRPRQDHGLRLHHPRRERGPPPPPRSLWPGSWRRPRLQRTSSWLRPRPRRTGAARRRRSSARRRSCPSAETVSTADELVADAGQGPCPQRMISWARSGRARVRLFASSCDALRLSWTRIAMAESR